MEGFLFVPTSVYSFLRKQFNLPFFVPSLPSLYFFLGRMWLKEQMQQEEKKVEIIQLERFYVNTVPDGGARSG